MTTETAIALCNIALWALIPALVAVCIVVIHYASVVDRDPGHRRLR